ncbi:hypothetical protein MJK72_22420 [Klebsiella pneumoniae]|nr:hypothetical protein MJK72_22420 [Klebsiella pneumoniae]
MSDGIVIIGSSFAARQLVKNIRKQDAQIPMTLIAADSMDEYNKPDPQPCHQPPDRRPTI